MLKKLKTISSSMIIALSVFLPAVVMVPQAHAVDNAITNGLCEGISSAESSTGNGTNDNSCITGTANGEGRVNSLIKTVINLFSLIVGVVSVIMIIVGGLKYITSGGDSGKVGSAKNTIIYALIGLVIVALSQVIVRFVLSRTAA